VTWIGCSDSAPKAAASTIVVGVLVPETGPNANPYQISAGDLALSQVNDALAASSASRGIRFTLEKRNDESDNAKVPPLAQELIGLGAPVLLGCTSGTSMTINKMNYDPAAPANTPVLCGACTNSKLNGPAATGADAAETAAYQDNGNWLRRTTITPNGHLAVMLKDMFTRGANQNGDLDGNGTVKVSVLIGNDANANTQYPEMKDSAAVIHAQPTMLKFERVTIDSKADSATFDYAGALALATDGTNAETGESDGPPDFLVDWLLPAYGVGAVKAYKQGGYTIPMMNSSSFRRVSILQTLGADANGQEGVSNQAWTTDASGTNFLQAFTQTIGAEPAGYDSSTYDAMAAALLGILRAAIKLEDPSKVTGTQVRDALDLINVPGGEVIRTGPAEFQRAVDAMAVGTPINYEGASGPCDFDAVGDIKGNVALFRVEEQKFVETRLYDCISDPSCPLAH
jgi:ABC-type branched-subunit amino acid transport system substrate-binding protein